jgi:hypothetical protein
MQLALLARIASNQDNAAAIAKLPFLPEQLSLAMRRGTLLSPRASPARLASAASAAEACVHMVARTRAFGRYTHADPDAGRRLAAAGAFVAAMALAQHGTLQGRATALSLLHCGVSCSADDVQEHVLSLGLVPLAWQLLLAGGGGGEALRTAGWVREREDPDVAVMLAQHAHGLLADIDGSRRAMAAVATAGTVPLQLYMLSSVGPDAWGPADGGADGGGGSGGPGVRSIGDGGGGTGGTDGTPAKLQ